MRLLLATDDEARKLFKKKKLFFSQKSFRQNLTLNENPTYVMRTLSSPIYSKDLLGNRLLFATFRLSKYNNSSPFCREPIAFRE